MKNSWFSLTPRETSQLRKSTIQRGVISAAKRKSIRILLRCNLIFILLTLVFAIGEDAVFDFSVALDPVGLALEDDWALDLQALKRHIRVDIDYALPAGS